MNAPEPSASETTVTLDVDLQGRIYKLACKESEQAELREAVTFLDGQMREIRAAGKVAAADRVAVMAALNMAHELLRLRRAAVSGATPTATAVPFVDDTPARRRIQSMQSVIDQVLADHGNPS